MSKTETFMDLVKGAAALGAVKAREAVCEAKEALKLDLGNALMTTYQRYLQDGWPEDRAKKMTLDLAKSQLEKKIEEQKAQTKGGK